MITRYVRLFFYFLQFSFSRALEFRFDFFFRFFMDLVYYTVQFSLFKIIYTQTTLLGGWTHPQLLIFMASYFFIDALSMTLIMNNMWNLPIFINKGDLDYYIVRPVSSLFFLSFREVAVNSFLNLVFVLCFMVWAVQHYPEPVAVWQFGFLLFNLLIGTLLYYLIRMLFLIPVFWTHSSKGFDQAFWSLTRFMERPDRIFTGWIRRLLLSVIPFAVMASFPARLFLEGFDVKIYSTLLLLTLVFYLLVVLLWRLGLRAYSSASS